MMRMIKQNFRLLFGNARYLMGLFLICLLTCILLEYQEKQDSLHGVYRNDGLNWALTQEDPLAAVEEAMAAVFVPVNGQYVSRFTDSTFGDYMLLSDLSVYLRTLGDYEATLDGILASQQASMQFSGATEEMVIRSTVLYEQYSALQGNKTAYGNYLAWEKLFAFGIADIAVLLMVFLTVYFLIVAERERGMGNLVFASSNGGSRYFAVKLVVTAAVSAGIFIIVWGLKYLILENLYGFQGGTSSIQSMNGYLSSPYRMTIRAFGAVFMIWKLLGVWLIAAVVLLIGSLPLTEAGSGIGVIAVAGLSALELYKIPATSGWVKLRDASLFQLWNPEYWFTGLRYYSFGHIGDSYFQTYGMAFPAGCACVYAALLLVAGALLYHMGLRKSGRRRFNPGRIWRYRGGLWGNEFVFTAMYRRCLLLGAVLVLLPVLLVFSFSESGNQEVKFERQFVEILNGKSFGEACRWLEEKTEELDRLEDSLAELSVRYGNGELSRSEYESMTGNIYSQLTVRPIVDNLNGQAEEMRPYIEKGIPCKFEFTALSEQMYGDAGMNVRLMIGVFISVFLVFGVLTIFPMDRQQGMPKLFASAQYGARSVLYRSIHLICMTFLVSLILHGIWLYSLYVQFGENDWSMPAQSWSVYRESSVRTALGTAVMANGIWQSVKWAAFAVFGIGMSMLFTNVIWVQIAGIIVFLCPVALGMLGVPWISYVPYYRFLYYGGQDICRGLPVTLLFILFTAGAILWMGRRAQRWIQQ